MKANICEDNDINLDHDALDRISNGYDANKNKSQHESNDRNNEDKVEKRQSDINGT